jgi:hypothetical protein
VVTRPREWARICTDKVALNIRTGAQLQDRRPLAIRVGRGKAPVPPDWEVWIEEGEVRAQPPGGKAVRVGPAPKVGELIWVRECWRTEETPDGTDGIRFRADDAFHPITATRESADRWMGLHRCDGETTVRPWRPSIHMPRWACRTERRIARVWVEHAQDISEDDAAAEGLEPCRIQHARGLGLFRDAFAHLLDELYPGSWPRNDWLLAVALEVAPEHAKAEEGRRR